MNQRQSKENLLEAEIVGQIQRYRMTTVDAAAALPSASKMSRKQLSQLLRRMSNRQQIAEAPLFQQRRYFFLPDEDTKHSNQHGRQARGALSEDAKIRNYAILAFCCFGKTRRHRLTAEELALHLPDLDRFGLPLNYYLDNSSDTTRVGFIRVDTGGRGRWDRVLAKVRDDVRLHTSRQEVRRLIEQDAFEVTLITARPQKATRLTEELNKTNETQLAPVRIAVVPELLSLIAPLPLPT